MQHSIFEPKVLAVLILSALLLTSCISYYKTATIKTNDFKMIDSLNTQKKHFILHSGSTVFNMSVMSLDAVNNNIKCRLNSPEVPSIHSPAMKKTTYIYNKVEKEVLNEVHFIAKKDSMASPDADYTLSIDNIKRIEIIQKDKEKTRRSHIIGYSVLGVILIANIVFAASSMMIYGIGTW